MKHDKSKLTVLVGALALILELTALSAPTITAQPQSQTVWAGTNVTFTVTATGTAPLGYQWRKGGANLTDGGNVSGAATAALMLANVGLGDAGNYDVMVTNASGSVTSAVAVLTVLTWSDMPIITNGLVAYYPFAGNANDESGNGMNGSVTSAVLTADRFGRANSAYQFSGTSYILVAYDSRLNFAGDFTVSCWVWVDADVDPGVHYQQGARHSQRH